jgi:hypothetical protein
VIARAYTGDVDYRKPLDLAKALGGAKSRAMRALVSVRQLLTDTFAADERVTVLGRTSLDSNAGEDSEEVEAEHCQPVGLVARPESGATVAVVVANVGADGTNPYLIGAIDSTRQLVIDARQVGAALDVTIVYNSTDVVELRDGKIRAGSLGGTTQPVPTQADFNALVSWCSAHRHDQAGAAPGPTSIPTNTPPLAPVGAPDPAPAGVFSQRFEVE